MTPLVDVYLRKSSCNNLGLYRVTSSSHIITRLHGNTLNIFLGSAWNLRSKDFCIRDDVVAKRMSMEKEPIVIVMCGLTLSIRKEISQFLPTIKSDTLRMSRIIKVSRNAGSCLEKMTM